jgi:uncharacterized membrane protein YdjX (TVP38/TMEM64 family)
LGALLDFLLARWYGRPLIEKIVSQKLLDSIDGFLTKHGALAIFITRLTPVFPFKVISYAAGLTAVSPFKFAAATAVGQTPVIVLYSFLGQNLGHNTSAVLGATFFLLVVALGVFYFRARLEKYLDKKE